MLAPQTQGDARFAMPTARGRRGIDRQRGRAIILLGALSRTEADVKEWMCVTCGFVYEEAVGHPSSGIAPGTRWQDVPDDWACPDCGAPKSSFEMIEV